MNSLRRFGRKNMNEKHRAARTPSRRRLMLESLEERCLMSNVIGMPPPTPGLTGPGDVLWYDQSETQKTITLTNNSPDQTIFPFIEDANNRTPLPGTPYAGTGTFDPFDPLNQEYRGYIGYKDPQTGDYDLGLLPGKTITINVPLVFWDSGRINISTDDVVSPGGSDLLGPDPTKPMLDQLSQPNPFLFHYVNTQAQYIGSTFPNTANSQYLQFTPIYNQNINVGMPTSKGALVPTTLQVGMVVSGPGIPDGDTIESLTGGLANSITLKSPANLAAGGPATQTNVAYVFTLTNGSSISPTQRYIVPSLSGSNYPTSITNGYIMWYHALTAEIPHNSAPFQLAEFTIRGDYYAANNNPGFQYLINDSNTTIGANDFNLFGYNVSFVDSMALPVAIEADNVPVTNNPQAAYPYGWIGSSLTIADMQSAIKNFAGPNGVGSYFGANGYPSFYGSSG